MKPMPRRDGEGSSLHQVDAFTPAVGSPRSVWQQLTGSGERPRTDGLAIGHFRIEQLIGRGGMGAVFAAIDTRLDRRVAIKVLSPDHSGTQSSVDRFRNEAKAAARLDHDNIARVFFVGEDHGLHYIAFEFIQGGNLRERIRQTGRMNVPEAVRVGLQIAAALQHTNQCGVVHRDIKPSNIIITPGGRAKLVDLGLARKQDPEATHDITIAGTTLGTFDYISPEQARDPRNVDVRSDIYSLGCTLYHALTGQPPYAEGTMLQKLLDHNNNVVPHVRDSNPKVSVELSDLIYRMMLPTPEDRPQNPQDVIRELSAEASRMGLAGLGAGGDGLVWTTPMQRPASLLQRHLGWMTSVGLLLLVSLALALPLPGSSPDELTVVPSVAAEAATDDVASVAVPSTGGEVVAGTSSPVSVGAGGQKRPGDSAPPAPTKPSGPPVVASSDSSAAADVDPPVLIGGMSTDSPDRDLSTTTGDPSAGSAAADDLPFVLAPNTPDEEAYPSLSAAIRAADDLATIEVRGSRQIAGQHQARLRGKQIRLRGEGSGKRPTLVLAADVATSGFDAGMVELADGDELEIYNLNLVVAPSSDTMPAPVFSMSGRSRLHLSGVLVTLADPPPASRLATSPIAGELAALVRMNEEVATYNPDLDPYPGQLEIENSLIRGNLHFLEWDGRVGADIVLEQVGLAISGEMLQSPRSTAMTPKPAEAQLALVLDHVTAMLPGPAIRLETDERERPTPVEVESNDCLFATFDRGQPFLKTMSTAGYPLKDQIDWSGERNRFDWAQSLAWDTSDRSAPITFARWFDETSPEQLDKTVSQSVTGVNRYSPQTIAAFGPAEFELVGGIDTAGTAPDGTDAGVAQATLRDLVPIETTAP